MALIKTGIVVKIIIVIFAALIILLRFEIIGQPMLSMSFRYSDRKIASVFKNEDLQPEIKYHNFQGKKIRYIELITNESLPYVVFIHGAPGSSADYFDYFRDESLYSKVNLISVDRLGYGYSDFGKPQTSIQYQAEAINSIIEKCCTNQNVILVGHSFGGPVALRMAMDYPGTFSRLFLLAPALDPDNEQVIKLAYLAVNAPTSWVTPKALKVAANEKFAHSAELKKMLPFYDKITIPVYHFHGNKDSLVPYENLNFSKKHFLPDVLKPISIDEEDHFLPWSQKELITKTILEAVKY